MTTNCATAPAPSPVTTPENPPPTHHEGLARPWLVRIALLVMALTSFSLVSAEFLPGGMLTTMAADLGVTSGQAGQTITVTALIGFIAAPTVGILTPGLDRRTLLVGLAVAAAVSNLVVAIAPSLPVLLLARLLLGAALSGFWAMSLTVAARIVGTAHVARGMMFVNTGTTLATVLGVPLGVYISSVADWRVVFAGAAVVTLLVAVALRVLLPSVPAEHGVSPAMLAETLRRPGVPAALTGHVFTVLGHMAAYAFIRVAMERMPDGDTLAPVLLLVFGAGGFIGNFVVGMLADRHLDLLRFGVPGTIAITVLLVALFPGAVPLMFVAVALWGAGFGGWLIVINTWSGRMLPDRLEAGGGLIVAGFQLAITLGAGVGGLLVDHAGIETTLLLASLCSAIGMVLFGTAGRRTVASEQVREPALS